MCRDASHDLVSILNINMLVTIEAESRMTGSETGLGGECGEILIKQSRLSVGGSYLFLMATVVDRNLLCFEIQC